MSNIELSVVRRAAVICAACFLSVPAVAAFISTESSKVKCFITHTVKSSTSVAHSNAHIIILDSVHWRVDAGGNVLNHHTISDVTTTEQELGVGDNDFAGLEHFVRGFHEYYYCDGAFMVEETRPSLASKEC